MNYTRKRALLACDFCRHRKRRCDGERPCSTCRESNADCRYKDLPVDRVESPAGSAPDLSDRLSRIEALLERHGQQLDYLVEGPVPSSHSSTVSFPPPFLPPELASPSPASQSVQSFRGPERSAQFLIPRDHSASANALLASAQAQRLLGEYPRNYFFEVEQTLPLAPQFDLAQAISPWPSLSPAFLDTLAEEYFTSVHPGHPLFNRETFREWRDMAYDEGSPATLQWALCCCVWALGALVYRESGAEQNQRDDLGLRLFQPAFRLILTRSLWAFEPSLELCHALLLAGSYFAHTGRPLHHSRMVYLASRNLLLLLDKRKREGGDNVHSEETLRAFWVCFMMECDNTAEFDVPRSGIEPRADRMPLPRSRDPSEVDDVIYFVAETAIRRLLNRILSSLYEQDDAGVMDWSAMMEGNSVSPTKMITVSAELGRQLEEWYRSIPSKLSFATGIEATGSDRGKMLRMRYYAANHLIYRPFVLSVAREHLNLPASPSPGPSQTPTASPIPRVVLQKCEACIRSCTAYLESAVGMLDWRSPYLWMLSQGCMACLLVLLMAASCPQLRHLTPEITPLQATVVGALRRWAVPGSGFEAVVNILESVSVAPHQHGF